MDTALNIGIRLHRGGRLDEAATIYQQLLTGNPNHADALHLLGVLSQQRGQPRQAIQLIGRAIARKPGVACFHANLAEAHRALGQVDRAVSAAQTALKLQPEHAEAANNLGLALLDQGNTEQAIHWFREALRLRPNEAMIHNNLGNALRLARQSSEALAHFRRAVELNPKLAQVHGNLGQLLLERDRRRQALAHCRTAVRLAPRMAEAHSNLGNVLRELGHPDEAGACYREALRLNPNLALVYNNLGQLCQQEGNPQEAITWYEQGLEREPNSVRIHTNLASALEDQDRFAEAADRFRHALQLEPHYAEAHNGLGHVLHEQGLYQEAISHYQEVVRLHPQHAAVHCNLGTISEELGKQDEARAYFREAVRLDPDHAGAYAQLATLLRDKLPDDDLAAMRRLLARPGLGMGRRSALLFGLAQYLDAKGDYQQAAQQLEEANALCQLLWEKRGTQYDPSIHTRFVDGLLATCTADFFGRLRGFGLETERPIFIVGLPRSGTTLTEQILASHSHVFGAGELCYAGDSFHALPRIMGAEGTAHPAAPLACLGELNRETVRRTAQWHLERLGQLNGQALRIADKMPENYVHLGLLATLFPRARFIHCRRDLRDIAVSCWITHFRQVRWSASQDNIACHFTQYCRLMDHWRSVLPVPLLEIDYEDTVADLEGVARRLIAWCGLEWEPACLAFHKSSRPIRTASVTQVRQPIYNRSVARWQNYEASLGPLFARLKKLMPANQASSPGQT
jgi:tetratricopeptide (TPR) repeat protein